jgi:hypothetical protein
MHHSSNDSITTQGYADQDTVWKMVTVSENEKKFINNRGRHLMVNPSTHALETRTGTDAAPVFIVEDFVEEKKEPKDSDSEDDAPKVEANMDRAVWPILKQLAPIYRASRDAKEFRAFLTASMSGLHVWGRDVEEVVALHARTADGFGPSANLAGIFNPGAARDLAAKVRPPKAYRCKGCSNWSFEGPNAQRHWIMERNKHKLVFMCSECHSNSDSTPSESKSV